MYFLAKVLCEVLPLKLGPVVVCFPVVYAMAGLRRTAGALFFWEAACLAMGAAATAVVILCILLLDSVPLGYAVSGIILSFMMVSHRIRVPVPRLSLKCTILFCLLAFTLTVRALILIQ